MEGQYFKKKLQSALIGKNKKCEKKLAKNKDKIHRIHSTGFWFQVMVVYSH